MIPNGQEHHYIPTVHHIIRGANRRLAAFPHRVILWILGLGLGNGDDRRIGGPNLQLVAELIPWAILGIVVLVGALSVLSYGLPWESKQDASRTDAQIAQTASLLADTIKQVNALTTNQAVMQETVKNISNQSEEISELRKIVEQQAIHIEGLEADEKANDSERNARMGERRR